MKKSIIKTIALFFIILISILIGYENPELIEAAWEEHRRNVGDHEYYSLLGDRKPPLDYRK